jgi:predicted SprT family Zn-dependent metalloprotease
VSRWCQLIGSGLTFQMLPAEFGVANDMQPLIAEGCMAQRLEYTSACPFCPTGAASVRAVNVRDDVKTLTYRCDTCNRSWETRSNAEPPLFTTRPGADQRTES